ncbi:hypothetical protein [Carboxylicivirga sp. N1Y90]|uniref:hypothetical protein n=1 Tax=Carboxylicivirga fragile TaxID=3417571 RepID=UPI003D32D3CC|nr:hypothetical protein [Marinilabiliaceae bacterium N1Y90]
MRIFCLLIYLQLHCLLSAQYQYNINIVDDSNKLPLSLVKVTSEGTQQSFLYLSDITGGVKFNSKFEKLTLEFSHTAYKTVVKTINAGDKVVIKMHPMPIMLCEVVVFGEKTTDTNSLIQKCIKKLETNVHNQLAQFEGSTRMTRKKNGRYVFFAEATFKELNGGYEPVAHVYNIRRSIESRISNQDYSISAVLKVPFRFPHPSNHSSYNEILLPLVQSKNFIFLQMDTIFVQNKMVLKVHFKANPNSSDKMKRYYFERDHYGEILINAEDLGVKTIIFKKKSENGSELFTSRFEKINGKYYLVSSVKDATYSEQNLTSNKLDTIEVSTMYSYYNFLTPFNNKTISEDYSCSISMDKRFGKEVPFFSFNVNDSLKKVRYDSNYWNSQANFYDWKKVCDDLRNLYGIPVEEQFANNSEALLTEKQFIRVMNNAPKQFRKTLKYYFKSYKKENLFYEGSD